FLPHVGRHGCTGCTVLFFFFSSRRRHTRSKRDWSSDVCSSDLSDFECPFCTVANEAQNGHSKSEYSVTSIRAESAPSVKPLNPSLAATGSGALAAGVATGAPREPYQITPPPISATAASST